MTKPKRESEKKSRTPPLPKFLEAIKLEIDDIDVSDASKMNYKTAINKLVNVSKQTIYEGIIDILNSINNTNSKHTFISQIKSLCKHIPDFKNLFTEMQIKHINELFDELRYKKFEQNTNREQTDKQRERTISWSKLHTAIDRLTNPIEKMIIGLYVLQAPLRSDYGDVRILHSKDVDNIKELQNIYVYDTGEMIISQFKTSNSHDPIVWIVNDKIKRLIDDTNPSEREYLIFNYNKMTKNKPVSSNYLGHKIQEIMNRLFNQRISINDLRHSFVAEFNITNTEYTQVLRNAELMGSSVTTQIAHYMKATRLKK
jgi:hypothetical protein